MGIIRGVNKNIIEISDTGNDCFERAILFVRPNQSGKDCEHLKTRAGEYLYGLKLRPFMLGRSNILKKTLTVICGAVAGGVITAIVLLAGFA